MLKYYMQAIKCGIADLEDVDIQDKSGLSRYFSDAEYKVQFMKVGNHCVVQLNGGSLAANIIKDINNLGKKEISPSYLRRKILEEGYVKNFEKVWGGVVPGKGYYYYKS